jgi:peptidoglycan/LPS O-acetylase OafA/YrhL
MRPYDGSYRPDIDGLRALAILLVAAFHFAPGRLSGGFVGVDVFFVISGYLITAIVARGLAAGDFGYADFYARRIRRICPALVLVLLATVALGRLLLSPKDIAALGSHVAGGALFLSNLLLWRDSGPFDSYHQTKPLLHLWSLGVEAQFYLLWPAALALIWRAGRNRLALVGALAAMSFIANAAYAGLHPYASFYLPVTRLWELLAGALLALGGIDALRRVPPALREALSVIGLSLILAAAFLFDGAAPYPGWRALLPVVGALCVIAAGPQAWLNRRLLGNRAAVAVGLISYPLYLWHWPLLTLALIHAPEDAMIAKLAAASLALVAAIATYRFVELPLRRFDLMRVAAGLCAAMAAVAVFGAAIYLGVL